MAVIIDNNYQKIYQGQNRCIKTNRRTYITT